MDGIRKIIGHAGMLGVLAAIAACGPGADGGDPNQPAAWPAPDCEAPSGTWAVGFSRDGGASVNLPSELPPNFLHAYSGGLLALEEPGWMLLSYAVENEGIGHFMLSKDSGCNWESIGEVPGMYFPVLEPRAGNTAYAWDRYTNDLVFIDADRNPPDALERRYFPHFYDSSTYAHSQTQGFASSLDNPDEVAYFNDSGYIQYSHDGGRTWAREDRRAVTRFPGNDSPLFYQAAFDRTDLRHVTIGVIDIGLQYSFDGGDNWEASVISSAGSGDINCFDVRHAPADPDALWAVCIDIDEATAGAPTGGRHIYRSGDGGQSFEIMFDHGDGVILTNGTQFWSPPGKPEQVMSGYFGCYNTSPDGITPSVTDIYRYDHESGQLEESWHSGMNGFHSLVFAPDDPDLVYFGLDSNPRC